MNSNLIAGVASVIIGIGSIIISAISEKKRREQEEMNNMSNNILSFERRCINSGYTGYIPPQIQQLYVQPQPQNNMPYQNNYVNGYSNGYIRPVQNIQQPTQYVQPVQYTQPVQSTQYVQPTAYTQPTQPTQYTQPAQPTQITQTQYTQPVQPVQYGYGYGYDDNNVNYNNYPTTNMQQYYAPTQANQITSNISVPTVPRQQYTEPTHYVKHPQNDVSRYSPYCYSYKELTWGNHDRDLCNYGNYGNSGYHYHPQQTHTTYGYGYNQSMNNNYSTTSSYPYGYGYGYGYGNDNGMNYPSMYNQQTTNGNNKWGTFTNWTNQLTSPNLRFA